LRKPAGKRASQRSGRDANLSERMKINKAAGVVSKKQAR